MSKQFLSHPLLSLFLVLFLALVLVLAGGAPAASAAPTSVSLAGNFENAATGGACNDWTPACAAAHLADQGNGVWRGQFNIPSALTDGQYKMALNDGWNESYAGNHTKFGNTTLVTGGPATVTFYYDDKTHAVLDSVMDKIATVAGDFQSKLGCPGDWQPGCVRTLMVDPDGDGVYMFESTSIPVGSYQFKVARDEAWNVSYPGNNVVLSVTKPGQDVRIYWDSTNNNVWAIAGHAHDNNVEYAGLAHDSRDTLYRAPGGAVAAGTPVQIRFRTFHNDVTDVTLRVWDVNANAETKLPMNIVASDVSCYDPTLVNDSCDFWQATLKQANPNNLWYRFIIRDGTSTAYYADDTSALDGGIGAATPNVADNSFALMFYVPDLKTPEWMSNAIIYQIFPDRFRNGDASNDPKAGDPRYDVPVITMPWGTLPEGYCRNYANANPTNCAWRNPAPAGETSLLEVPYGRDYYGGDLKGVKQELDYLQSLGVNAIYFNPIFAAKSNHRYDTANYKMIDPYLGTLQDFQTLAAAAKARGMHIILDGVFNHMSSDSPQFDRYHHYAAVGACESATSTWRKWFTFIPPAGAQPSPCVPSTPGGSDTYYQGWFGFDSIPVLTKTRPAVQSYFLTASDSVSRYWLQQGASGWRLDVMNDSSFPDGYWETFRQVVKSTDPSAVIIGELWQKDSSTLRYLRGDRADSTMGYRFRDAMMVWLSPNATFDSKGFPDSGHPVSMSQVAARLLSIREDYPDQVYYDLMNILDSHDTERAAWTLAPGALTRDDRELNTANLATGKLNLSIASLVEFSVGGAPTIYYGDEAGMTGNTDPDDRRTYPWGNVDNAMLQHYQMLSQIRKATPALTDGKLQVLLTDEASRTLVIGRKTSKQAAVIVAGNGGVFDIPVGGYLPDGTVLNAVYAVNNPYNAVTATVANGNLHVALANKGGLILVTAKGTDLLPPIRPDGVKVTQAGNGFVSLIWNPVDGAAGYNVYYSPVSGGGWVKANSSPVAATRFQVRIPDTGAFSVDNLTNATVYYFIVRAVDAAGNESKDSAEASAIPHLIIDWANLQWPPKIERELTTTPTENIYGQVHIAGVTAPTGPEPTLRAQVGFGPVGTDPSASADWVWTEASFNTISGDHYEYMAQMLPTAVGKYAYVYRYSTTNGAKWAYGDLSGLFFKGMVPAAPGILNVKTPADTTPPTTPTNLIVTGQSPVAVSLAWDASTDNGSGIYQYQVRRSSTKAGPFAVIGTTTGTTFTDNAVSQGKTYYYVVRAVDNAFNLSTHSNMVQATANPRTVTVVFNVTVPSITDASGRAVHIAGTLSLLNGGLPDWDPSAPAATLTRLDSTHWTITLTGNEETAIQYKYALGDWNYVEKDASCGEVNNRALTLTYGATGQQNVNDTVLNWRNDNQFGGTCGN